MSQTAGAYLFPKIARINGAAAIATTLPASMTGIIERPCRTARWTSRPFSVALTTMAFESQVLVMSEAVYTVQHT